MKDNTALGLSVISGLLLLGLSACYTSSRGGNIPKTSAPDLAQPNTLGTPVGVPENAGINNSTSQNISNQNTSQPSQSRTSVTQPGSPGINNSTNQIASPEQSDESQKIHDIYDKLNQNPGDAKIQSEAIKQLEELQLKRKQDAEDHQNKVIDTLNKMEGN